VVFRSLTPPYAAAAQQADAALTETFKLSHASIGCAPARRKFRGQAAQASLPHQHQAARQRA